MTDHVELLHLMALDASRTRKEIEAKILFEAAEYFNFLETSMMDEMQGLIDRIASLEQELESLRS